MVRSHGIQSELANWIYNWIGGRSHSVLMEGCFSDWRPKTKRVLRGSVLGHLLIVIYLNNFHVNVGGMISKLTDGTKIGGVMEVKKIV